MKTRFTTTIVLGVLTLWAFSEANAQQIPYLSELLARYAAFNRLYTEKKHAGADLSALEPVRVRGETAFQKGDLPGVIEATSQGLALLQGQKWDDTSRFLSSLTLETDRLVLEPNESVGVSLARMYPVDESKVFPEGVRVTFALTPKAASQQAAGPVSQIVIAQDMRVSQANTTADRRLRLLDGPYSVIAVINAAGKELARIQTPIYAISDFSDRLDKLSAMITVIKGSMDPKIRQAAEQISTPEFQLRRLADLTKSNTSPELNPIAELGHLESVLAAMAGGANPLASERGEIERAYRSSDGQLVPYRIYVPSTYDGSRALPLVVALHGALGDEQSYFSGIYDPAIIKGEAERRGYIIATPKWLGRFGGNGGAGEEDVMRVIKEIQSNYNTDPARIYLTGHSMGGFGAWQLAFDHPEVFAAMAPVSGGSPVKLADLPPLLQRIKSIPVLVVHGSKDGIVPPARSREIVDAARKAGLQVTYMEVPGADHLTVVGPAFPAIMEFFAKQSKQAAAK
jgi:predicted esterase